ncbi:hypothetical protein C2845_PM13G15680 [Panicum miliaceum]|uniref:Secreted protein n=1 Tax=Panicum miliaceum TaxID=4540 RepID=A0A3L6RL70_PANMI|nr:hypothetical protein C2845_PM13G15680 [Panicum miliaceum]
MRVFILIWGVFVCGGDRNPRVILQPSAVRGVGVLSVILVQRLGEQFFPHDLNPSTHTLPPPPGSRF